MIAVYDNDKREQEQDQQDQQEDQQQQEHQDLQDNDMIREITVPSRNSGNGIDEFPIPTVIEVNHNVSATGSDSSDDDEQLEPHPYLLPQIPPNSNPEGERNNQSYFQRYNNNNYYGNYSQKEVDPEAQNSSVSSSRSSSRRRGFWFMGPTLRCLTMIIFALIVAILMSKFH